MRAEQIEPENVPWPMVTGRRRLLSPRAGAALYLATVVVALLAVTLAAEAIARAWAGLA